MKIINIHKSRINLARVLLNITVGWHHEPLGMHGISHFLEHALFLGNEEYPDPDKETGKYGVMLNGETLPDRTIFYFTSMSDDAPEILRILLSLIFNPSFPFDKVMEEKKSKIIPAMVKESDYYPWELAYEWARNLVFDWDFRHSMGTEEDLEQLGIEDIKNWHRKYYHSNNAVLLTSNSIDFDESAIPDSGETPSVQRKRWDKREIVIDKNLNNAEIVFAFPYERYDLRTHLLSVILGNYPTSLLWKEFHRDAYMVESRVEWHGRGGFFIYIGANTRDVKYARKRISSFLEKLKISREDVEIAKKIFTIEALESGRGENSLYRYIMMDPELRYAGYKEIVSEISAMDHRQLTDFSTEILSMDDVFISAVV